MTGGPKDNLTLAVAYSGIAIFTVLYSSTISQYLLNTTDMFWSLLGYFFLFVTTYYMLRTTFTDPGVIPRGTLESA